MIRFFKKHWLLILLATLAAFLAGIWILKPFLGEKIDESLPKLKKIEVEGVSLNPQTRVSLNIQTSQKSLAILNAERKFPITALEMNRVAQGLEFLEEPTVANDVAVGTVYIWNKDGHSLSITPQTNEIDYSQDLISNPPTQTGTLPNPQQAKEKLLTLLDSLGISFPQIDFVQKEHYLAVSGFDIKEITPGRASILRLSLNPVFTGIPIITNSPDDNMLTAEFDRRGEVLSFKAKNSIASFAAGQQYHLKNPEDIRKFIISEGEILNAQVERHGQTIEEVYITSIQLTQASLAYFLPQEGDTAQPIYVLEGTAYATGVQQFPVTIYLPAIKSGYFTPQSQE